MAYFLQQSIYVLRLRYFARLIGVLRKSFYRLSGMKLGKRTALPQIYVTWPHQVSIGKKCILEKGVYFKYDGIWKKGPSILIGDRVFLGTACEFNIRSGITIGDDTLIASGCRFIDHDHGTDSHALIRVQQCVEAPIKIGKNAWLGCNVIVLKGVEIGEGAIVAAGAVVNKSIPANEIWAGVPAKKVSERKQV